MRPTWFAASLLAAVLACTEPDTEAVPALVSWMEWPAEVRAATPFTVRLVVGSQGRIVVGALRIPLSIDNSAVTFEPYFLSRKVSRGVIDYREEPVARQWDTTSQVPGLAATFERTYEIRATATAYAAVRTFGTVTVWVDGASAFFTNAAGFGSGFVDSLACLRIRPAGLSTRYVVVNPPLGPQNWSAFVRGYLYRPATPVCGEQRVFYLESRN